MAKALNLAGQTIGQLSIAGKAPNRGRATYWHCLCKCGRSRIVRTDNLTSGRTVSCGFGLHHMEVPPDDAAQALPPESQLSHRKPAAPAPTPKYDVLIYMAPTRTFGGKEFYHGFAMVSLTAGDCEMVMITQPGSRCRLPYVNIHPQLHRALMLLVKGGHIEAKPEGVSFKAWAAGLVRRGSVVNFKNDDLINYEYTSMCGFYPNAVQPVAAPTK